MSTKRVSKKVISNVKMEQFEEAMSNYAVADAKEAKMNAIIDEKATKIRGLIDTLAGWILKPCLR